MLMKAEAWKQEWGTDNLVYSSDAGLVLPRMAREFLTSYGLPRRIIFENPLEGNWEEYVSSEITFELISKPLVSYSTTIIWGEVNECEDGEEDDNPWSRQIVIGEEEFCNGHASYCVHQFNETVTRIDVEAMEEEIFVNSSLPQYGESLLLAVRWSKAIRQSGIENWQASLQELANAIKAVDVAAFERRASEWPRLIKYALDNEPGFLEITDNLKRSKPRF
jgi:SUKH-4 immunity protein